jgi:hypothetical protein
MEIHSYRRVFDLERRLYRVDRLRLNPGGVPVRGIVYLLVLLGACVITASLPVLGAVERALPWYLSYVVLPGASATVLSVIRVEGRPFHLAARSLVGFRLGARWLAGMRSCMPPGARWQPPEIVLLPDGSDGRMRRLRFTGPGAVLVAVEHERTARVAGRGPTVLGRMARSPDVTLTELVPTRELDRALVVSLQPGARLLVRPRRAGM